MLECFISCSFFFFQAEDGIRDIGVTGVQTCALPICTGGHLPHRTALVSRNDLQARRVPGEKQYRNTRSEEGPETEFESRGSQPDCSADAAALGKRNLRDVRERNRRSGRARRTKDRREPRGVRKR